MKLVCSGIVLEQNYSVANMQHHCKKATKRLHFKKVFSIITINNLVMFSPSYSCTYTFLQA
jgi:hypothetical protein